MWKLTVLIIISSMLMGCEEKLPEATGEEQVSVGTAGGGTTTNSSNSNQLGSDSVASNDNNSGNDNTVVDEYIPTEEEDDHTESSGDDNPPVTVLRAAAMLSSTSEALRLGEQSSVTITVMTDAEFEGGDINVSLDRTALDPMDNGTYVVTNLSESVLSGLSANDSRRVTLNIESKTMAPSFDPQRLEVVLEKDGLEKRFPLFLQIMPIVEVAIISGDQQPYMYNRGMSTCFRHHSEGLTVIFSNRTDDFAPGSEPCIHTQGALQHCPTSQRMGQDEVFINPRKPGEGGNTTPSNALYYDHFNSAGDQVNNNRRLYFNVTPGQEQGIGRAGNNCE